MLLIIKNHRIGLTSLEYLLIDTEKNILCKRIMCVELAEKFVTNLDAVPTAPIELLGTNYKVVDFEEFNFQLPI